MHAIVYARHGHELMGYSGIRTVYPFAIVTRSQDRAGVSNRSRRVRSADHRNRITDRHGLGTLSLNSLTVPEFAKHPPLPD